MKTWEIENQNNVNIERKVMKVGEVAIKVSTSDDGSCLLYCEENYESKTRTKNGWVVGIVAFSGHVTTESDGYAKMDSYLEVVDPDGNTYSSETSNVFDKGGNTDELIKEILPLSLGISEIKKGSYKARIYVSISLKKAEIIARGFERHEDEQPLGRFLRCFNLNFSPHLLDSDKKEEEKGEEEYETCEICGVEIDDDHRAVNQPHKPGCKWRYEKIEAQSEAERRKMMFEQMREDFMRCPRIERQLRALDRYGALELLKDRWEEVL